MKSFLSTLLLVICFQLTAQTYIPDTTFGTEGVKNYALNKEYVRGVLLNSNYYLMAYDEICKIDYNGNFVANFGTNGHLNLAPTGTTQFRLINIMVSGNSIYVYGFTDSESGNIYIYKINENGILDTTFGINGKAEIDFGLKEAIQSMVINPDGTLFCVGSRLSSASGIPNRLIYFKVNSNGSVDTTFDNSGYKSVTQGTYSFGAFITPYQGGYLMAGEYYGSEGKKVMLVKVDSNGILVSSFGSNGLKFITIPNDSGIDSIGSHDLYNNKLYLVTSGYPIYHNLLVYDMITETIVSNPSLQYSTTYSKAFDDGIYVSGYYWCGPGVNVYNCSNKFNLRRKNFDGTPDTNFQNNTVYEYTFPSGYSRPYCIIKDDNGKILIVGNSFQSYPYNAQYFSMLRLTQGTLANPYYQSKSIQGLYPNPFTNEVFVITDLSVKSIELSDVTGRTIGISKFEDIGDQIKIDVSFLPGNGTYFLKVICDDGTIEMLKIISASK